MGNLYTKENLRPGSLIDAIHHNDQKISFKLEDLNFRLSAYNWTYLHLAVWMNRPEIVEKLIGAGADINAQDENGDTALNLALITKNREISTFLLECGAKSDVVNVEGVKAVDLMIDGLNDLSRLVRYGRIETEVEETNNQEIIKRPI